MAHQGGDRGMASAAAQVIRVERARGSAPPPRRRAPGGHASVSERPPAGRDRRRTSGERDEPEASAAGERALVCAVLADAVSCLAGQGTPTYLRRELAAEARSWVAERDARRPFSFEHVCAVLDLDPEVVRSRLLATARALPAQAGALRCRGGRSSEEKLTQLIAVG